MVKKYWVCEHDLDWFQERIANPPEECDFQVIKLSDLNELLETLDVVKLLKYSTQLMPHYLRARLRVKRLDFDVSKVEQPFTISDGLVREYIRNLLGIGKN